MDKPDRRELKLSIQADFSTRAIEDAVVCMNIDSHKDHRVLTLTVSVFEARDAVRMLVDGEEFIYSVSVSRDLTAGAFILEDDFTGVYVKGGI